MNKKKLGICICDKAYEERFVRCMMNHYKEQYEIHILSSLLEIVEFQERIFDAIIVGDEEEKNMMSLAKKGQDGLILREEEGTEESQEHLVYVEKYQEVYKIVEELRKLTENHSKEVGMQTKNYELVGISSFCCERLQLPFASVTASVYGEKHSVLLIDLQPFSAMDNDDASEGERLGMEDLMSVATTGIYTKSRILGAIGHEQKWDYIHPVKNTECLVEANEDIYIKMIDMLAEEQGYDVIILNFGAVFSGMFDLMDRCQTFYCLEEKGNLSPWREFVFCQEMKRRGKERFLQKIIRMELVSSPGKEQTWKHISQQWLWGTVGNQLRDYIWAENYSG